MRKVVWLGAVLAALFFAAPAAADVDNGTIGVSSDGVGGLFAHVGGGDFTFVDQPSASESEYSTPQLNIDETVSLSANTFTVSYTIANPSSAGPVTFEPKMLADLAPGGDTTGIGVTSPGIGARTED